MRAFRPPGGPRLVCRFTTAKLSRLLSLGSNFPKWDSLNGNHLPRDRTDNDSAVNVFDLSSNNSIGG